MSLLHCDGFDNLGPNDGGPAAYGKWYEMVTAAGGSGGGNAASRSLVAGRYGGAALQMYGQGGSLGTGSTYNTIDLGADTATFFVGFAWRETASAIGTGSPLVLATFYDNALTTTQLDLRTSGSNFLNLTRNGTVVCTSSATHSVGAWHWVEVGAFISPTAGWCELKLNGVLVATYYGTTGTNRGNANGNTRATTVNSIRFMRYGAIAGNSQYADRSFDDLLIMNSSGATLNDHIGERRVVGLLPTGAGATTNLTRVGTAATNWQAVNNNPLDGDVTYVSSSVPGTYDTYALADLPSSTTGVDAVVAEPVARRDDVGVRDIVSVVRSAGSEATGPATASPLLPTYRTYQHVFEVNPVTLAGWTVPDLNQLELGVKLNS